VRRTVLLHGLLLAALLAAGCTHHTVEVKPIEVKPITVNVNFQIDRELDQFFDFEDELPADSGEATGPTDASDTEKESQ